MSTSQAFTPGATVTLAVVAASISGALGLPSGNRQVLITSPAGGTQVTVFIRFGNSAVVATAADTPILPGTAQIFSIGSSVTHIAAFGSAAGPTALYATTGHGE